MTSEWIRTGAGVLRAMLELSLSPSRCAACDERLERRSAFCPACAATVERATAQASGPRAFGGYGGSLAIALRRFKYEGRTDLAAALGGLAALAAPDLSQDAIVVPVPLHPDRLIERGYNQSALLARQVAKARRLRWAPTALVRERHTLQQATLSRQERLRNVAAAFSPRCPERLRGARVILVDDVMTTGATLEACGAALVAAGAREVQAVVVARAEAPSAQGLSVSAGPGYDPAIVNPGRTPLEPCPPPHPWRGAER